MSETTINLEGMFLTSSAAKLRLFTDRIGICLAKLTEDQVWARGHENENAVGNLILHLCGNVRQWIISGLGGQTDIRQRDQEFSTAGGITVDALVAKLRQTVEEATAVISGITAEQLMRIYQIQGRTASGMDAIYNVVEHFSQHTGQIIFATKFLTGEDLGLTIPKAKP